MMCVTQIDVRKWEGSDDSIVGRHEYDDAFCSRSQQEDQQDDQDDD